MRENWHVLGLSIVALTLGSTLAVLAAQGQPGVASRGSPEEVRLEWLAGLLLVCGLGLLGLALPVFR